MIAIVTRLFKFEGKLYKVGKHNAPELCKDHWFLNSLVEQGFLTIATVAQQVNEEAKKISADAEEVENIAETITEEVSKRGRPKKEAITPEV